MKLAKSSHKARTKLAPRGARNQCRVTLETPASIKSLPVVYACQANVTSGPQQINNGIAGEVDSSRVQLSQLNNVSGREPMAVAIAVAAQPLQERQRRSTFPVWPVSLSWRQFRSTLLQEPSINAVG